MTDTDSQTLFCQVAEAGNVVGIAFLDNDDQLVLRNISGFGKKIGDLFHEFRVAGKVGVRHLPCFHLSNKNAATVVHGVHADSLAFLELLEVGQGSRFFLLYLAE